MRDNRAAVHDPGRDHGDARRVVHRAPLRSAATG
jgi:hypothetical protein